MEEKNKTYTALDFARYHAGTMSSAETHALEKAALEDPFLADALEGYAYIASPEKDIAQLQRRLADQPKKKKIFFISSFTQNKWWRVAALFIIVIGIGFLFYRTNNNNHLNTKELLATNSDKKSPEKIEGSSPVLKDSGTVNDNVAFERQEAPGLSLKNKSALPKINEVKEHENINAKPKLKTVKTPGSLNTKEDNPISGSVVTQQSSIKNEASNEYVLKGKITDENGQAIPFASIEDENQKKITVTDSSGQFALTTPDSNAKVNASAVGYASKKNIALQKDRQPIIAMNKNEATLSEVVVTSAYENKRKRALSPSANLQGKVAGVEVTSAIQPFPVSEEFTQYMEENLIPVYDSNNERLTGKVVLSFNINKRGRPQDISVLKSTCKGCEEQAIRLLANGPDWAGKKNVQGTVEIKF